MARKSKRNAPARLPVVQETLVPGGKILTRKDGAERFVSSSSSAGGPQITYTKVKRGNGKVQGKVI